MTDRSVTHATFSIDRVYEASPSRVFSAFADPAAKRRWFADGEGFETHAYTLDFRVGGREHSKGSAPGGVIYSYDATFEDIVPDERIILTYYMHLDDKRISVSLATVELKPESSGTRLTFTEQGAFLDGFDNPELREQGSRELLEALAKELQAND